MNITERIKQVRKDSKLSQEAFATSIGQKRGNYSQVELGNQMPTLEMITNIARIYSRSYQWLLEGKGLPKEIGEKGNQKGNLRGNPTGKEIAFSDHIVDISGMKLVPLTDIKAAAGQGYLNPENFNENEVMRLPVSMVRGGNHLIVSIKGTSMAPTLQDGGKVLIRLLDRGDWATMINERLYVVVDMEGKTYLKRVKNRLSGEKGFIVLSSDSPDKVSHPSFNLQADEIQFIWYVEWYFTAKMPNIHDQYYNRLSNLEDTVQEMQAQFLQMKKVLK